MQNLVIKNVQWGVEFHNVGLGTSVANNVIWAQHYGIQSYRSLGEDGHRQQPDPSPVRVRVHRHRDEQRPGTGDVLSCDRQLRVRPSAGGSARYGIAAANMVENSLIKSNTTVNMTVGIALANAAVTNTLVHGDLNRNAATPINSSGTNTYTANNS